MKQSIAKSGLTTGLLLAISLSSASASTSPHGFLMQHNSTKRLASSETLRLRTGPRNETDLARANFKRNVDSAQFSTLSQRAKPWSTHNIWTRIF